MQYAHEAHLSALNYASCFVCAPIHVHVHVPYVQATIILILLHRIPMYRVATALCDTQSLAHTLQSNLAIEAIMSTIALQKAYHSLCLVQLHT